MVLVCLPFLRPEQQNSYFIFLVLFDNYKIRKEFLLSKTGDVDDAGNFISPFKDPRARMGQSLGALSGGRVNICEIATTYGVKAITIALRYAASRKQFGPEDSNDEYAVIEYQAQQYRLLPHLASIYAVQFFSTYIGKLYGNMTSKLLTGEKLGPNDGIEMHALSSAGKPIVAWTVRDVIQECREACGGHGYLKCARLGDLRNDNDANCTYEGENNILIQQTSNVLLNSRSKGWQAFGDYFATGTTHFLKDGEKILQSRWTWKKVDCAVRPESEFKLSSEKINIYDLFCRFAENSRLDLRAASRKNLRESQKPQVCWSIIIRREKQLASFQRNSAFDCVRPKSNFRCVLSTYPVIISIG